MPELKRIVGIYAEGSILRLAVVCRENGRCHVESVETIALRDPLLSSGERARPAPSSVSDDPFGIHLLIEGTSPLPAHRTNPEILLDIFARHAAIGDGYALGGDPRQTNFAVFQNAQLPHRKGDWVAQGRLQGIPLTGEETPQCLTNASRTQWVFFHPPSFPLLDLFQEANHLLGKYKARIRLVDDPRVSLIEAARLHSQVPSDEHIILLHREASWGCLIELRGGEFLGCSNLSPSRWQEDLKTWFLKEEVPDKKNLFLLSGTLSLEEVQALVGEMCPAARVESLVPLALDAAISDAKNTLTPYAIPVTLAAKSLSRHDSRFYPALTLPRVVRHRRIRFKSSLAAVAVVVITLLLGGCLTLKHIHQSDQLKQVQLELSQLEATTDAQMKSQPFYLSLDREFQNSHSRQTVLDSLISAANSVGPSLDALCAQAAYRGGFWLTEYDFSSDGVTISGTALNREFVDEAVRALPGALLLSVTTREVGKQTVYPFTMTVSATNMTVRR